jgi:hypothetical protein
VRSNEVECKPCPIAGSLLQDRCVGRWSLTMTVLRSCKTKRGIAAGAEGTAGVCVRRAEPGASVCGMCDIYFLAKTRDHRVKSTLLRF